MWRGGVRAMAGCIMSSQVSFLRRTEKLPHGFKEAQALHIPRASSSLAPLAAFLSQAAVWRRKVTLQGGPDNYNGQVNTSHREKTEDSRCPRSGLGCPTTPPECG